MNEEGLEQLLTALLYEGYILYPYRVSALKNRRRFTFGRVYPEAFSSAHNGAEPCAISTECLIQGRTPVVELFARFLQPIWREVIVAGAVVDQIEVGDHLFQTWQEAVERVIRVGYVSLPDCNGAPQCLRFEFPGTESSEPEFHPGGIEIRRRQEPISGVVGWESFQLSNELWKISLRVSNTSALPENPLTNGLEQEENLLMRTFASTHAVLRIKGECGGKRGGRFISLLEPPQDFASQTAQCRNHGVWPVLIGNESRQEAYTMLASPIILYDFPKLAPESALNHFDGTEIDELLALRIMCLTDAERNQMRQADERARRILEFTEDLPPEQLLGMHGAVRKATSTEEPSVKPLGATVRGVYLQAGARVRICPAPKGDIFDLMLAGKRAVIESVEQDFEERIYFALILDEDPGKDIGFDRMPGHRFFFFPDEVEPDCH